MLGEPTSERQRQPRRATAFFSGDQRRQRAALLRRDLRQAIGERGDGQHAAVVDARTHRRRRRRLGQWGDRGGLRRRFDGRRGQLSRGGR